VINDLGIAWSAGQRKSAGDKTRQLSYEDLPSLEADVIYLLRYDGDGVEPLCQTGLLDLMSAARANQIFEVDSSPWYRGGLAGLNIVVDDGEWTLADKTIDTSGSFR
jgi:ABC-type Fe3+-hydroxamate transport system substrate-binding protein